MSVTIENIMHLPCMRDATILAGKSGLGNVITSVTVLEYSSTPENQSDFYEREYLGSELVITAFSSMRNDPQAQCREIRDMKASGAAGLVLYYLGLFFDEIDPMVLRTADEIGFVFICMPPRQYHLRYSETISGIEYAIFQDQNRTKNFAPTILDTLASLPHGQQNIDALLRILSDYLHTTLVLTDDTCRLLAYAAWPNAPEQEALRLIDMYADAQKSGVATPEGLLCAALEEDAKPNRRLLISGETTDEDVVAQICSTIKIFRSLYPEQPESEHGAEDFIRAVLGDEPIRMRREARLMHIDETKLHNLIIYRQDAVHLAEHPHIMDLILNILQRFCRNLVLSPYDGDIVVLLDNGISTQWLPMLREIQRTLTQDGLHGKLLYACNLDTTTEVRNAYLLCRDAFGNARRLFPTSELFSYHELRFALRCAQMIGCGEEQVQEKLQILRFLHTDDARLEKELYETLSVFYFDAHHHVNETAERMFVHPNTVKYRLRKIAEKLGCSVTDMPEMLELYTALAIKRLLNS